MDGKKLWEKELGVSVPANTSTKVWSGNIDRILGDADRNNVVLNLSLTAGDYSHEGNFYMCKQSELKLADALIDYEVTPVSGGYSVTVKSDKFVRALYLSIDGEDSQFDGEDSQFDDNYFDLLPDKPKCCSVKTDLAIEDFKSRLKIKNLTI